MNQIKVDFGCVTGEIKPLHGVCCAPYQGNQGPEQTLINQMFTEAHIPYCRLHDCCGSYGGAFFVDVPNIFRDFDADETDPDSYDFHYTDEYIGAIQKAGCEAYYRLGVTIEWGSKKYRATPPKDFAKWARICERIIMHYNEGWANGFHYDLKYWEIWNEPENPGNPLGLCMWTGTKQEFFDLYAIASKYLKSRFPQLKIGGYGSCGFYTITRDDSPESFQEFVPYFTDFLTMVKEKDCPLDFFSWHIYTGDEKELEAHAKYVRETLDEYGFCNTEAHLNEWNIHAEGSGFAGKHTLEGASFNAAVFCMLQQTRYVDKAMYYCFSARALYNGLLDQNDGSVCPSWYPFVAFGHLYTLKNSAKVECSGGVYAAAAKNGGQAAVLLANYNCDDEKVNLSAVGIDGRKTAHILMIAPDRNLEEEFSCTVSDAAELFLKLPRRTAALVKFD